MSREEGITSGRIADLVSGSLVGRSNIELAGIAPLGRAGPGDLSFLASSSYLPYFRRTNAGAVLVSIELQSAITGPVTCITVPDVREALGIALEALYPTPETVWGVHHTAVIGRGVRWSGRVAIGPRAKLGRGVVLGTDCVVEEAAVIKHGAVLGDRCHIGSFAFVGPSTEFGDRVFLKAGARVGMAGYGYATTENGHVRLPHIGGCFIGNDVEIGTNTTIDRGSIDDTVVGAGTKIDNLVQIAHNVRIGERCLIMAQVGLAGSTKIEDDVLIAGQAGLAGHLTVGKGARLAAQAGVIGDVPAGATVSGYPARSHRDVLRQSAALRRLTGIVSALEKIVERNVPK